MADANAVPDPIHAMPTWRRVPKLVDLVEIFEPGVQVCAWQREIDPAIAAYLAGLDKSGTWQVRDTLPAAGLPQLAGLPPGDGRTLLVDDLALLGEILCELIGCPACGVRVARVGHAMCPGWHIDRVGLRLACTYQGPGTEWLADQGLDPDGLRSGRMADSSHIQAGLGEIVLLKGALWQGNERFGALHRSPQVAADAAPRTLVTLDPLWRA